MRHAAAFLCTYLPELPAAYVHESAETDIIAFMQNV